MKLKAIDFLMMLTYIAVIVAIGIVQKKRAQRSNRNYLLGDNELPWYMLGLSNASGMFDISGTIGTSTAFSTGSSPASGEGMSRRTCSNGTGGG